MSKYLLPQSFLVKCIIGYGLKRQISPEDVQTALKFISDTDEKTQWELCRVRTEEVRKRIIVILEKENWPCVFPVGHQMFFKCAKNGFRCNRISIQIAPDTYSILFMETSLLQPGTTDFVDEYGYKDQDVKRFKTWEELISELRRMVDIYKEHE